MRPNFHPVDFHSFIGVTRKSTVTPPVPNLKVPFDSKGYTHTPPRREASILPGKEARHARTQKVRDR